jgi:hypothetical protein
MKREVSITALAVVTSVLLTPRQASAICAEFFQANGGKTLYACTGDYRGAYVTDDGNVNVPATIGARYRAESGAQPIGCDQFGSVWYVTYASVDYNWESCSGCAALAMARAAAAYGTRNGNNHARQASR